jgi:hypothetical protein
MAVKAIRLGAWLAAVVVLSACNSGGVSTDGKSASRQIADYDSASSQATTDPQCSLPVSERQGGWFCAGDSPTARHRWRSVAYKTAASHVSRRDHLSSVTYVVRRSPATTSSTGATCGSGAAVHVRLIGRFPDAVNTGPLIMGHPTRRAVRAIDITAEAASGRVCLYGTTTGHVRALAGGTQLVLVHHARHGLD